MMLRRAHATAYLGRLVAVVIAMAVGAALLTGCNDGDADLGQGTIHASVASASN